METIIKDNKTFYSMYNGTVELSFDNRRHFYQANGEPVISVTRILGIINKPALMYWAVNKAIEYLDNNLKVGMVIDEVQKVELLEMAKKEHRRKLTDAANKGTLLHEWVELYNLAKIHNSKLPDLPINPDLNRSAKQYIEWINDYNIQPLLAEEKIYSKKYNYAGTLDLEAREGKDLIIADIKTSSGIWNEYYLQTAAYLKAREEESGNKYKARWIVRISKDGEIEFRRIDKNHNKDFKAFLGALVLQKRDQELTKENKK